MNPPVLERPAAGPRDLQGVLSTGGPFCLNLGGRETKIPGFLNVDLFEGPGTDILADCSDLRLFPDQSVTEIYASHILEHWPHTQTLGVLKEWCRVLKRGGVCYVSVPDFEAAVRLVAKEGLTDFVENLLWGDQGYDLAYHYAGFTFSRLAALLVNAGFEDVKRRKWMPYTPLLSDCSSLVDTHYHLPISLTVEAIK